MSNLEDSDFERSDGSDDYDSETGPMTGKVTEKNPNYEKEDECKCVAGCESESCQCYKFGQGCNASCGCTASCKNMFNGLDYFFGDEKYSANPCFAKWLVVKKDKSGTDLKKVNRNALLQRIMRCSG